jgi:hypothetical protein
MSVEASSVEEKPVKQRIVAKGKYLLPAHEMITGRCRSRRLAGTILYHVLIRIAAHAITACDIDRMNAKSLF